MDLNAGWVNLDPGTTKNNEGRRFPMIAELAALLGEQRQFVSELERKYSRIIPKVFVHEDGERIASIRKARASATTKAGLPGTLLHDLRRSGIMTFSQKGIDQQPGMLLSGHKTASVYRRYNIPTEETLRRAAEKLESGTRQGYQKYTGLNRAVPLGVPVSLLGKI